MLPAVGVSIRVGRGKEVPVDFVKIVWMLSIVLNKFSDNESSNSRADPFSSVNSCLKPDVWCTSSSLRHLK